MATRQIVNNRATTPVSVPKITRIQVEGNDTVSFLYGAAPPYQWVRGMSQIMEQNPAYISYRYDTITISQVAGESFTFTVYSITDVGGNSFVALTSQDPSDVVLAKTQEVYRLLVTSVFKGCCECGNTEPECSIQYTAGNGEVSGTLLIDSGAARINYFTANNQDFTGFWPIIQDGSWIFIFSKTDPTVYGVFQLSNYTDGGPGIYAQFDITLLAGTDVFPEGTELCVDVTSVGGSLVQGWQDTLIIDSVLTQDNTVDGGNFDFVFDNNNSFVINSPGGSIETDISGSSLIAGTQSITVNGSYIDIITPNYAAATTGMVLALDASGHIEYTLAGTGTISSIGLFMPPAFTVSTPNPLTSNGSFTVTGAGTALEYIDGTGNLQTFPVYTVENGLHTKELPADPYVFHLGGVLIEDTVITATNAGTEYVLGVSGLVGQDTRQPLAASNLGNGGVAVFADYASGARPNPSVQMITDNDLFNPILTLSMQGDLPNPDPVLADRTTLLRLRYDGTQAVGARMSIDYQFREDDPTPAYFIAGRLTTEITDMTLGDEQSLFELQLYDQGSRQTKLQVTGPGQLILDEYGAAVFSDGTTNIDNSLSYVLATDNTGRVWKKLATGGGTVTSVGATGLLTTTATNPFTTSGIVTSQMNSGFLVGRYDAGLGVFQEITVGAGLDLSAAGVLTADGSVPVYTVNNGLEAQTTPVVDPNNFQLGGPSLGTGLLVRDTYITNDGFPFVIDQIGNSTIGLNVRHTSSNPDSGTAIQATSSNGWAVRASINGNPATGDGNGSAYEGLSQNDYVAQFSRNDASSSGNVGLLKLTRNTTAIQPFGGIAGSIDFWIEARTTVLAPPPTQPTSSIVSEWTSPGPVGRNSSLYIYGYDDTFGGQVLNAGFNGIGLVSFYQYGQTPAQFYDPSPVWALGVDASGNVVEIDVGGGPGTTYTVNNGLTENPANNFQLGGPLIQDTFITSNDWTLGFDFTNLTGKTGLNITSNTSTSTAEQTTVNIRVQGSNASAINTYALNVTNQLSGGVGTNYGGYFTASGGASNYGIKAEAPEYGVLAQVTGGGYGVGVQAFAFGSSQIGVSSFGGNIAGSFVGLSGASAGVVTSCDNPVFAALVARSNSVNVAKLEQLRAASDVSNISPILTISSIQNNAASNPVNGYGASIQFKLSAADLDFIEYPSNAVKSSWFDSTTLSRTTQFQIEGTNSGVTESQLTILGGGTAGPGGAWTLLSGQLKLDKYAAGAIYKSEADLTANGGYNLGVDADGNVWATDFGGGSGPSYTVDNGLTENPANNFQLGGLLTGDTTIDGDTNLFTLEHKNLRYSDNTALYWYSFSTSESGNNTSLSIDSFNNVSRFSHQDGVSTTTSAIELTGVELRVQTPLYTSKTAGDVLTLVDPTTGEAEWEPAPLGGIPFAVATAFSATPNTYNATITGVTGYTDGDAYIIRFNTGNESAATLNINGIGAKALHYNNAGELIGGDIWDGSEMLCVFNFLNDSFDCIGTSPNSLYAYVTNDEATSITKGQAVYAHSGAGNRMTVKLAIANTDATSAQTIGIVFSTSIGANQRGIILIQGYLTGLTQFPTGTWTDGDPVYLSPTTPGAFSQTKPLAPSHLVYLGVCATASNGSAGRMYVRIQNGYEMNELHDVASTGAVNNDILYRDTTVTPNLWKPASIATILGYTPVTSARTISTTSPLTGGGDLSADRTLSIPAATGSVDGYLTSTDWTTFNNKAPLASPAFTGTPTAPTAAAGTNDTQIATTAFVQSTISGGAAVPSYTMKANNTGASAVPTDQVFRYTGNQVFTGTISTSAGSWGTGTYYYNWHRIGNMVNYTFQFIVTTPVSITNINWDLPADMPSPIVPTGFNSNSAWLIRNFVTMVTTITATTQTTFSGGLRVKSTIGPTFDFYFSGTAGSYKTVTYNGTYFTS